MFDKPDVRIPQRQMREITILSRTQSTPSLVSFVGRWIGQFLDRETGARYSLAETADGGFVRITKVEGDEAVTVENLDIAIVAPPKSKREVEGYDLVTPAA